jgi:pyruvate kinase
MLPPLTIRTCRSGLGKICFTLGTPRLISGLRYVDYKNITKVIETGRIIYVDDGVLAFDVLDIVDGKTIRARARNNGKISSKKGVNLPNTDVDLPALSEKDQADLRFGVKNNVDMVFASFIRRGEDIKSIRKVLGEDGKHIQIIAKIENRQGLNNFAEILEETDGVMVARGDLGIEIPAAEVFAAQKKMIAMCNIAGKPVICATQMLESMIYNPRPTRAEISDVGNAVTDGADCVMLSGETAKGSYPSEAVKEMHETCLKAENTIAYVSHFEELQNLVKRPVSIVESCAMAAVRASLDMNAGAIIVLSTSGDSARLLSKYRPVCPIFMVTRNASASRYGHLYRGVYPFYFPEQKPDFKKVNWQEDVDRRIKWGISEALKLKVLAQGETVVVVQGWKGGMGNTNTLSLSYSPYLRTASNFKQPESDKGGARRSWSRRTIRSLAIGLQASLRSSERAAPSRRQNCHRLSQIKNENRCRSLTGGFVRSSWSQWFIESKYQSVPAASKPPI